MEIKVINKCGILEDFDPQRIAVAIRKSASRVFVDLTDEDCEKVSDWVYSHLTENIPVKTLHNLVECALDECNFKRVAESYRAFRNYKHDIKEIWEAVQLKEIELDSQPDHSNANCNSQLVSTKGILTYGEFLKESYMRFFLTPEERKAVKEGFIYPHDMKDRYRTYNCCLLNVGRIMKGGFTLENMPYTEPGSVAAAIAVASDIISVTAGNQYGGLTWPQVDEDLSYYCQKSYNFYIKEYSHIIEDAGCTVDPRKADAYAYRKVKREIQQGYQGIEHTFNSVSSCRGDFPFISFSFGNGTDRWSKLVSTTILETRMGGQGKPGGKTPVLFPKLIFTYRDEIHGEGGISEDLFDLAAKCSKDTMYPDFLSLDAGYVGQMYKKTGKIITMMGCRACLSPDYNEQGELLINRCNMGVISLNLPMFYQKAKLENKTFYEVFDYYFELARQINLRTIEYLKRKLKGASSPLAFMEGGFDDGYLGPNDSVAPVLKHSTISFGYGGLSELQTLYNKDHNIETHYFEDCDFAKDVMTYFNDKVEEIKKEDNVLYAIYGTPGESWLPRACEQFIAKYGEVDGVTDKGFFSNSFHINVDEDVTPIEKIDFENQFFPLSKGGSICHVKIPSIADEMMPGVKAIIRHAMKIGNYQSVNHASNRCTDCGHHWIGDDSMPYEENYRCPVCGSMNTVGTRRMNGYLGYSKTILGVNKFNDGKIKEFKLRKNL